MHLALIGFGNIAQSVVAWLERQPVKRLTLLVRTGSVAAVHNDARVTRAAAVSTVTDDLDTLIAGKPDLVVECAGHGAVTAFCPDILKAGLDLVIVSVGALADDICFRELESAAKKGDAQLILPPGAIGGIDLLRAISLAGEVAVTYRGTKPPTAWRGTQADSACDLDTLTEPCTFYSGSARDAAIAFPKNANVAATLALAGAGFDRTRVELVADPRAQGNTHAYEVESPAGRFAMEIVNTPSSGNAKTSVSTAYSVIREISRRRDAVIL